MVADVRRGNLHIGALCCRGPFSPLPGDSNRLPPVGGRTKQAFTTTDCGCSIEKLMRGWEVWKRDGRDLAHAGQCASHLPPVRVGLAVSLVLSLYAQSLRSTVLLSQITESTAFHVAWSIVVLEDLKSNLSGW